MSLSIGEQFVLICDYLKQEHIVKSYREIAKKIGVSPALITEAKKGRSDINSAHYKKLIETYSVELDENYTPAKRLSSMEETVKLLKEVISLQKDKIQSLEKRLSIIEGDQKERNVGSR